MFFTFSKKPLSPIILSKNKEVSLNLPIKKEISRVLPFPNMFMVIQNANPCSSCNSYR